MVLLGPVFEHGSLAALPLWVRPAPSVNVPAVAAYWPTRSSSSYATLGCNGAFGQCGRANDVWAAADLAVEALVGLVRSDTLAT